MVKHTTLTFLFLFFIQNFSSAMICRVYILMEIDDQHIIIVNENYKKLLLKKWSLDFSPSLIERKIFNADLTPSWVMIYFDDNPIKWSIDNNL